MPDTITLNHLARRVLQPITVEEHSGFDFYQFKAGVDAPVDGRRNFWETRDYYVVATGSSATHPHAARDNQLDVTVLADLGKDDRRSCKLKIAFTAWCLPHDSRDFVIWHHQVIDRRKNKSLSELLDKVVLGNAQPLFDAALSKGMNMISSFQLALQAELRKACPHLGFDVTLKIEGVDFSTLPREPDPYEALQAKVKFGDYGGEVLIRTKLLRLKLANPLRVLLGQHEKDLKKWCAACVQEAAESACVRAQYIEFVSSWDKFKDAIYDRVKELAHEIGYEVVTLLNEPDTPEYNALRELSIEILNHEFQTKDTTLPAILSIYVTGRLDTLANDLIKAAIRTKDASGSGIGAGIKNRIIAAVQKEMHEKRANTIYLDFHVGRDGVPSVETTLLKVVGGVLTQYGVVGTDGNATPAAISIKLGQSAVQLLLNNLISEPLVIDNLEVNTVNSGEDTIFNFSIKVDGINVPKQGEERSYLALAALAVANPVEKARAAIVKAVQDHLTPRMNLLSEEQARYETGGDFNELLRAAEQLIQRFLTREYSLESHLQNIGRKQTDDEVLRRKTTSANRQNAYAKYEEMMLSMSEARRKKVSALLNIANDEMSTPEARTQAMKEAEDVLKAEKENIGLPAKRSGRKASISETFLGGPSAPLLEDGAKKGKPEPEKATTKSETDDVVDVA